VRLNYNHLRYFWAVAHNGNLTRTAEQLHVSQSALSLQIKKLEEQLGHALFERRGKQLVLTEAGRVTLDHADLIFASGAELVNTLSGEATAAEILRVGALSTLSRNFQIEFLAPLVGRENTSLTVRSGSLADLLSQLEAHRLDVVLTNTAPPRDAATPWIVRTLGSQPLILAGYAHRLVEGRSLEDTLRQEPLIVSTLETAVRSGFDAFCDRHEIHPRLVVEVDDMALMRVLTRRDFGLAVTPAIVVRDELQSGKLVEIHRFPDLEETFQAITLARQFPNPLLKILFESIEDHDWVAQPA
jgi:LysR family transcriptional activator of nhaA